MNVDSPVTKGSAIAPEVCLAAAERIAMRLCRDAIWDGNRCNWVGCAMEALDGNWTTLQRSFGPEMYSGTSGIGLFLGLVHRVRGGRLLRRTAEGALRQSLSRLDTISGAARIGLFSGIAGVGWALAQLAQPLERSDYVSTCGKLIEELRSLAGRNDDRDGLDIISGSAGTVAACLRLSQCALLSQSSRDVAMDVAMSHGHRLVAKATTGERGCSWDTLAGARGHLTGFSHGAAGIAWSLLELWAASGDKTFRMVAERGIEYEQHLYSVAHGNWPDLRDMSTLGSAAGPGEVYGVAWCHGAPGIGLSRVSAAKITGATDYRDQAAAAIGTTRRGIENAQPAAPGVSCCLCHGLFGNAETLLIARQFLGDRSHDELLAKLATSAQRIEQENLAWNCGITGGGESPGLMLGVSGIGHFLLRLADPLHIPSVLLL